VEEDEAELPGLLIALVEAQGSIEMRLGVVVGDQERPLDPLLHDLDSSLLP